LSANPCTIYKFTKLESRKDKQSSEEKYRIEGKKFALLLVLLTVWLLLGLAIAPIISLMWGLKSISNSVATYEGRYLIQRKNI
jgi:cell division septal protein FtsQ